MTNFVEKLYQKGMADENLYFAKRDRELIDKLSKERLARLARSCGLGETIEEKSRERRFRVMSDRIQSKAREAEHKS